MEKKKKIYSDFNLKPIINGFFSIPKILYI